MLFNFFLLFINLVTSFLFDSLIVTYLDWLVDSEDGRLQHLMILLVSLKIFRTISCKLLFEILSGISDISRHSRLEYCSFAAHFFFRMKFCVNKLSFTLLVTKSWDSIFVNLSLKDRLSNIIILFKYHIRQFFFS